MGGHWAAGGPKQRGAREVRGTWRRDLKCGVVACSFFAGGRYDDLLSSLKFPPVVPSVGLLWNLEQVEQSAGSLH